MNTEDILKIFLETGALLNGHFKLTSGLHSRQYFQCAKVLQQPAVAAELCMHIADFFRGENIETVIAPAIGGIVVGHEVARSLKVRSIFTEREKGSMALRRGFEISPEEKILVVEDVVTTGGSVKEVIELVRELGGAPFGVGCLVDRSNHQVDFGLPFHPLVSLEVKTKPPETCELCQEGIPIIKPGSRSLAGKS